jgi:hypothetical protein
VNAPIRSYLTVIENRGMRSLDHRKILVDFGIAVAVVLFFVAGTFFEFRRLHDRLPRLVADVAAGRVSTPAATQQARPLQLQFRQRNRLRRAFRGSQLRFLYCQERLILRC